jgi:hypothetical protein
MCWDRFAIECVQSTIVDHFFFMVRTIRSCMHIIKLPNPISKMKILKIIILAESTTVSKFKPVEELDFWRSANTPHKHYLWTTVNIVMVIIIVCLSRRWKAEQVSYKIRTQAPPSFTHLGPLNWRFLSRTAQHRDMSLKTHNCRTVHQMKLCE